MRKEINALLDLKYLDGVEINCHPLYKTSHFPQMVNIAVENELLLTCGADYHADTYRAICGMYLPMVVDSEELLGRYLMTEKSFELCVHEPNDEPTDIRYVIGLGVFL